MNWFFCLMFMSSFKSIPDFFFTHKSLWIVSRWEYAIMNIQKKFMIFLLQTINRGSNFSWKNPRFQRSFTIFLITFLYDWSLRTKLKLARSACWLNIASGIVTMRSGEQIRTLTRNGDISTLRFVTIQYRFSAMLQRGIKKQQQNIVRKFLSGYKTTVFDTQGVKKARHIHRALPPG